MTTENKASSIKAVAKSNSINGTTEKLINKFRSVDTSKILTGKENAIVSCILYILDSQNNAGYQFSINTIRKEFFNYGFKEFSQVQENYKNLFNGISVNWEDLKKQTTINNKNYINDDIFLKCCGVVTLTTKYNILPIALENGSYIVRLVKENTFFYAKKASKKESTVNKEFTEIQKMLQVATSNEFEILASENPNDLYTLINSLVTSYNKILKDNKIGITTFKNCK